MAPGVYLKELAPMTTLVVRTRNSRYRIVVSSGSAVWVSGGRFFPTATHADLDGASAGGSCLKVGWIGVGLCMELRVDGQRIVTMAVRGIETEPTEGQSIH